MVTNEEKKLKVIRWFNLGMQKLKERNDFSYLEMR